MTNEELRDQAIKYLQKTTDSYPTYIRKGRPATSNWTKAFDLLAQITDSPQPQPQAVNPVPPPAKGVWFAAAMEGRDTYNHYYPTERTWDNSPWDLATWDRFEQNAGKKVWGSMNGDGGAWNGDFSDINYILNANATRGAVPVIDSDPSKMATLADISAGKFDSNIAAYANTLKTFGKPMVLRPWCEMNGSWYRYAIEAHSNPPIFVSAWQHVFNIFQSVGATNVAFHWCPNVDPERPARYTPLEQMWPGDNYVHWAGITGYRHAANESVDWIFQSTYDRIVALTNKPIMFGEVASCDITPAAGNKVEFINTFFQSIQTKWPQVKALCWFNWYIYENSVWWDWPIESSPPALAVFKDNIASSYFVGR